LSDEVEISEDLIGTYLEDGNGDIVQITGIEIVDGKEVFTYRYLYPDKSITIH